MFVRILLLLALAAGSSAAPLSPDDLDGAIEALAKKKNLPVSGPCDDATFLRRVSLDLNGVIPAPDEVTAFLADARPDKRARKIDELLARPEFDNHWAAQLRGFMFGKTEAKAIQMFARKGVEDWLEERLRAKDGYDRIVSALITAEGPFIDNPATGFLMRKDATAEDLAARTGKVFLGAQIMCAQCHDHPFEKWTQRDFYGMAAFFARTRTVPVPEPALELVRAGVPLPMVRVLVMGAGEADALAGNPDGMAMQRMKRMARRLGFGLDAPGGAGSGTAKDGGHDDDDGSRGRALPPGIKASREEIMKMAEKARREIKDGMDEAEEAGKRPRKGNRKIPVVFEAFRGEAVIPDPKAEPPKNKRQQPAGVEVAPKFLDGSTPSGDGKRREQLAAWMTAPKNPYFAKAAVNRFFAMLVGTPLVAPVDNVAWPAQKALAPVLDRLAADFAANGHDLRALCKLVVSSRTYQRDLKPAAGAEKDRTYLTHATARQLTPEQLFASFLKATRVEDAVRGKLGARFEQMKEAFLRQFVFTFETDEGAEVELFHETIPQALMMLNSALINRPVQAAPGGILSSIASEAADPKDRVNRLYLATLSRPATSGEIEKLVAHVNGRLSTAGPELGGMDEPQEWRPRDFLPEGRGKRFARFQRFRERFFGGGDEGTPSPGPPASPAARTNPWKTDGERQAYEDILWSLVSCSEFLYNH